MSNELAVERRGATTHLLISRPEKGNALSAELVERLIEALQGAAGDGTRLIVLRGVGRHFCTGFDLSALDSESGGDLVLRFVRIERLLQLLYHCPVITVALAHGRIFGAGADIFCACNQRICTPDATFRFPGVRFGVVLGTRRLAARIGDDAAATTLLEGRELTAGAAIDLGLATTQLGQDEWPGAIDQCERDAEALSPSTTQSVLACLRPDTRDADMAALVASVSEPGFKDRIRAYRDKVSKR